MSHNTDTPNQPQQHGTAGMPTRPGQSPEPPATLPFLRLHDERTRAAVSQSLPDGPRQTAEQALQAIDSISRRIDDLARELNLLGHFPDDDPDRPRAA